MNLDHVKKAPKRAGKTDLIKHLEGKRLNKSQQIKAKCFDCNGLGELDECDIKTCPLWPSSPYGGKKPRSSRNNAVAVKTRS